MSRRWGQIVRRKGQIEGVRYVWAGEATYVPLPHDQRTRPAAEALLARIRLGLETGLAVAPSTVTVGGFLHEWLDLAHPAGDPRTGNTRRKYQQAVERLCRLDLAAVAAQKLTVSHVERGRRQLQEGTHGQAAKSAGGVRLAGGRTPVLRGTGGQLSGMGGVGPRQAATEAGGGGPQGRRGVGGTPGGAIGGTPEGSLSAVATGLAPKTINDTIQTAKAAWNWAIKRGVVTVNPWAQLDPLPLGASSRKAADPDQALALLTDLLQPRASMADLALAFLLVTGRRYSEMAGLRVPDVDFERKRYTTNQSWLDEQQAFVETSRGARKNKLLTYGFDGSGLLRKILVRAKGAQRQAFWDAQDLDLKWYELGLVFTASNGRAMPRSTIRKALMYACRRVGLVPVLALHELRHSAATMAIRDGAEPIQVQRMLGHASLSTTLQIYSHEWPEQAQSAIDSVARSLSRKAGA